jgi:glyoxylase-like metal-dependent hydrolase (beta-lactamase superfamily II)
MDVFGDGSLYIFDAPGHLPGHINLLTWTTPTKWVYLAGDACHERRIFNESKAISTWHDAHNQVCRIHADRPAAEATLELVRDLEEKGVEVILAHDVKWENDVRNTARFFGKERT